jgi:prephenate dehydratase
LRENVPGADVIHTSSNGKSAELLAKSKKKDKAAIVPKLAAEKYHLKILKEAIQDSKFNVTRFIVIGENCARKTGKDRTSIAIYPQVDRPGLLYELLGEFAKRRINLTKIESRPSKGKLGDYLFFIDMQGHEDEKRIKDSFSVIKKSFFLKVLGSYPRKY